MEMEGCGKDERLLFPSAFHSRGALLYHFLPVDSRSLRRRLGTSQVSQLSNFIVEH